MTGNYGNFPKYSAFAPFLLGLYWRKEKKKTDLSQDRQGWDWGNYMLPPALHIKKKQKKTQQQITISVYNTALLRIFCPKFSQYFESESWEDKPFY